MKKLLTFIAITIVVVACSPATNKFAYIAMVEGYPIKCFDYEKKPLKSGDTVFLHYTSYDGQWDILNDVPSKDSTYSEKIVDNGRKITVLHKYRKGVIDMRIKHTDF